MRKVKERLRQRGKTGENSEYLENEKDGNNWKDGRNVESMGSIKES